MGQKKKEENEAGRRRNQEWKEREEDEKRKKLEIQEEGGTEKEEEAGRDGRARHQLALLGFRDTLVNLLHVACLHLRILSRVAGLPHT